MKRNGFTLIELLVVIAIMAVLGIIFSGTLVQTLRGQNKVKIINQVKQNGQVALDKLSGEIRQAERVICIGSVVGGPNDNIIIYKSGTYYRFRLVAERAGLDNGYIKRSDFTVQNITVGTAESTLCALDTDFRVDSVANLTDTDSVGGVSIRFDSLQPVFSRNALTGYGDTVTIRFRAAPAARTGTLFENLVEDGGVLFNTTVEVRGIKK